MSYLGQYGLVKNRLLFVVFYRSLHPMASYALYRVSHCGEEFMEAAPLGGVELSARYGVAAAWPGCSSSWPFLETREPRLFARKAYSGRASAVM